MQELEIFAKFLAKSLNEHDVIFCQGDLGAGKTSLAKFLLKNIGVTENITSPTFNLHLQYESKLGLCSHYDLYRLKNIEEAEEIGLFDDQNLCFIEWPEIIMPEYEQADFMINITISKDGSRHLEIKTDRWQKTEYKLSESLQIKKS